MSTGQNPDPGRATPLAGRAYRDELIAVPGSPLGIALTAIRLAFGPMLEAWTTQPGSPRP